MKVTTSLITVTVRARYDGIIVKMNSERIWLPGAMVARLASIASVPKGCRFESCGGHDWTAYFFCPFWDRMVLRCSSSSNWLSRVELEPEGIFCYTAYTRSVGDLFFVLLNKGAGVNVASVAGNKQHHHSDRFFENVKAQQSIL